MDLENRTLWQVGAGDTERSYGEICLRHDVMIVGPGNPGPFTEETYEGLGDIRNSIRRFYHDARKGDRVLLRLGTGQVLALGEIADDQPLHSEAFGDVDGWDLQHSRRVRWFPDSAKTFPPTTLGGQVRTFAAVNVEAVRSWVRTVPVSLKDRKRRLAELPAITASLGESELARRLFVEGLPSEYVDRLMSRFAALRRVAAWYDNKDKRPHGRPSEHETVAYLVLPLLFSLGWSEQTAAVEWNRVDIALFSRMPSEDSTLTSVVEAKLLGRSVFSPVGQASAYALMPTRKSCSTLVVTDGIRYTVHKRVGKAFRLTAYLNILRLRDSYPALRCAGAVEALLGMARNAGV